MKYLSHYPQAQVRSTTVPCQASMMASSPMSQKRAVLYLLRDGFDTGFCLSSNLSYLVLASSKELYYSLPEVAGSNRRLLLLLGSSKELVG